MEQFKKGLEKLLSDSILWLLLKVLLRILHRLPRQGLQLATNASTIFREVNLGTHVRSTQLLRTTNQTLFQTFRLKLRLLPYQ